MPTFITPVEVTPGSPNLWLDVDVSAYVPVGTTGVMLHIVNTNAGSSRSFRVRKNGSTDDRVGQLFGASHIWACIGVDGSRIFEAQVANTTDIDIYLIGYFGSEAVFFDNAVDVSTDTTGSFQDVDISGNTGADTAIGAFLEMISSAGGTLGLRKNGSTDNRLQAIQPHSFGLIGVDASEIFEQQISATSVDLYLIGYIKSNAVFNTNATDRSLGGTGAWTDLAALPAGAIGGIYEITGSVSSTTECGLRENGSSENIIFATMHHWGVVECDDSQLVEMNIESTNVDVFEIGYFTASAGGGGVDVGTILQQLMNSEEEDMTEQVQAASADVSVELTAISATTGLPVSFSHDTAGISMFYWRAGSNAKITITAATLASLTSAHTDGGVEPVDATAGKFRFDLPDAAVTGGARTVYIGGSATDIIVIGKSLQIVGWNPSDSAITSGGIETAVTNSLNTYDPPTRAEATSDKNAILAEVTAAQAQITTVDTVVDRIEVDTQDIQSRLPATLDSGRIRAKVENIAGLTLTTAGKPVDGA